MGVSVNIKDRLTDDWRAVCKHWSTWAQAAGAFAMVGAEVVKEAWMYMPTDLRATLPYTNLIALGLFSAGLLAKFVKQKPHG